jgi:hypothetical protein
VEYAKSVEHLCEMFNCEKCLKNKIDKNLIVKENYTESDVNLSSDNSNRFEDEVVTLTTLNSARGRKRRKVSDDKVTVGCQDSCICILY